MAALTYTDGRTSGAVTTDLNDTTRFVLRALDDGGIVKPDHQAVATPNKDGQTYIRTTTPPRFVMLDLRLRATSYTDLQTTRRNLAKALNPKYGVGVLKWTPVGASPVYALDCIVAGGAGLADAFGSQLERARVSLVAFSPFWYNPTANAPTIVVSGTGLSVPVDVPVSIPENSANVVINNTGDVETFPVISAPGPFADPHIENVTTGKVIRIDGLRVLSGETLTVDMDKRTAKVGTVSVLDKVQAVSEFWSLGLGNNTVKVTLEEGGVAFTVTWYERFIGV